MTIGQFQEIYLLKENAEGMDDLEITCHAVAIMQGKKYEDVVKMSVANFNKACAKINRYFELNFDHLPKVLRVNGRNYWVNYKASETAGRYIEGVEFGKDIILNLHKILATCVQPISWYGKIKAYNPNDHAKYAEDMRQVKFEYAYAIGVFFYRLFNESMKAIQPYMVQEAVLKGLTKEEVQASLNDLFKCLDGLQPPSKLQTTSALN
jgi:uncharacterized protein YlzI (FlbEa/FlbD family)